MNILAAKNKLIVEPEKPVTKSVGGITLPESAQVKPNCGVVIQSASKEYKVGTTVYYSDFAGVKLNFDKKDLIVLKEEEVLAFVN